jgi:hypothetical protein
MLEINGSGGLCLTCNNSPTCYYRAKRGPALLCEMFDNYVPFLERSGDRKASVSANWSVFSSGRGQIAAETGLCLNCTHLAKCMHPRPDGGVWRCEDYE